ncbi:hypothetical protein N431DRAFT_563613 [Stipitochalara longipes BDJ]|nr:hypothetical protein N431DRAFT_563613 [Stipitochalara longipes BDJ]
MGPKKATAKKAPPKEKTIVVPDDVQDIMNTLPPTSTGSLAARNSLFPYLALGFGPVKTSGTGLMCGVNSLWCSYKHARETLAAPGDPPIAKHKTQKEFEALLKSQAYQDVFEEYLQDWKSPEMSEESLQEQRDEAQRPRDVNITSLSHLLEAANRSWGTNFELGTITKGYRCKYNEKTQTWDSNFAAATSHGILSQTSGRPIIWIWNNNATANHLSWGGRGGVNHWEGLGPPAMLNATRRNLVRDWNLGGLMRQHIAAGVWRVTRDQVGVGSRPTVATGAFVHAATPPEGVDVPEGSRYVTVANEEHFLIISEENLIPIVLHAMAPTAVEGGVEHINVHASGATNKGKNNVHNDQKSELAVTLSAFLDSFNTLAFFRAVAATKRIGGNLNDQELPLFSRDNFRFNDGDFLLDLGARDGPWARVRTIDSKEGWAHARRLQALELPWNLPRVVPFKIIWTLLDFSWDAAELGDEQRRRGLIPTGNRKNDFGILRSWDEKRTAVLPMRLMDYLDDGQKRGVWWLWSDNTEILDKELVLEAAVVEKDVTTKIVSFDRETAIIANDEFLHIPQAAWGIKMTPEELVNLVETIGKVPSATEQSPKKAEAKKEEEAPSNGGAKRPRDEDNEGQKSTKKLKKKKKGGKVRFEDAEDDTDELG